MNVLGRVGTAAELSLWNNNIQNVGGIQGVASAFVRSPENRLHTVVSYYQSFLHRPPTDSEASSLVNSSQDLLTLEATVLSLNEFLTNG
jgi:hypothetical protein